MESGVIRRRLRYVNEAIVVTLAWMFTDEQNSFFRGWFKRKLNLGVSPFNIELDLGEGFKLFTAHFSTGPSYVDGGKHWMVNAEVRISEDIAVISEDTLDAYILADGDSTSLINSESELDDLVEITLPETTNNIN